MIPIVIKVLFFLSFNVLEILSHQKLLFSNQKLFAFPTIIYSHKQNENRIHKEANKIGMETNKIKTE